MTAQEPAADAAAQTTAKQFASPDALHAYLRGHPVVSRILWNRGYRAREELDALFHPELSLLPDPLRLLDMKRAVERVADAILHREKITIYGDYDVDGTCGSALLLDFFGRIGVEAGSYQPDRFAEGYGVNLAAVERLIAEGTKVLITVVCGLTTIEQASFSRAHGTDMIVLDHHKLGSELPAAFAVVDPQRPEDTSGLQNLCGTGIAFFFSVALRAALRARGCYSDTSGGRTRGARVRPEPNLKSLLDLVAVATVADMVDVRGVNRILLTHGMQVLGKSPRPGLRAILEAAGVEKPTAKHCGFVIGPRINAAGRLKHARAALVLLTSKDQEEARGLAQELEALNTERRATQASVTEEALKQAREQIANPMWAEIAAKLEAKDPSFAAAHATACATFAPGSACAATPTVAVPWPRALVLHSERWHEGVVGIVASKVVEEFGRPVFILAAKAKEEASAEKEIP